MNRSRCVCGFMILVLLLFAFFAANICAGSVRVPLRDVLEILLGKEREAVFRDIVTEIRFPRALSAGILGGALALSGYLLQILFDNPIAGPFTLGISSGARLSVALVMVVFLGNSAEPGFGVMIMAAFAGAMISMGFVILMSRFMDSASMLIVSGVMIGYICSAITDLVVAFADDADIVNLHNWSKGSFSGIGWSHVAVMFLTVSAAVLAVFFLSKPIGAYGLGEAYAQNLGLDVKKFRILLVLLSSALSACVTAFAGPVSFVGIAVPHMVKYLFRTARPAVMIPACFLGGGVFCLGCDLLARILFAPRELSISTVTAVLGAPVVILIMAGKKQKGDIR